MSEIQGSIVVKRVRQGDTVTTRLESDKALYQGITDGGWLVNPDWTVAGNQPTITPKITTSLRTGELSIIAGSSIWKWNGMTLVFGGDGVCTGVVGGATTGEGLFHRDSTTGALKIIGNLATSGNTNIDKLRFDALVNTGYETAIGADIEVRIELVGKNSYTGVVDTTAKTFKEGEVDSITATARLTLGITTVAGFKTEWLAGESTIKAKSTDLTCAFSRADVSGSQIFLCNYYVTVDGSDKLVSTFLFVLYDGSDPYYVELVPVSQSDITDSNGSVEIKGTLKRRNDGIKVSPSSWEVVAYNVRAQSIALSTGLNVVDGCAHQVVLDDDTDKVEAGQTEPNGDITLSATATI